MRPGKRAYRPCVRESSLWVGLSEDTAGVVWGLYECPCARGGVRSVPVFVCRFCVSVVQFCVFVCSNVSVPCLFVRVLVLCPCISSVCPCVGLVCLSVRVCVLCVYLSVVGSVSR